MAIDGSVGTERADHVDLARRIVDVIVAADHVRDLHVQIVDDNAEVVGGRAVAAGDDQVVELVVGDLDAALHLVVPGDNSRKRILESHDRSDPRRRMLSRFQILRPPAAVVARLFAARALLGAQRVELRA